MIDGIFNWLSGITVLAIIAVLARKDSKGPALLKEGTTGVARIYGSVNK